MTCFDCGGKLHVKDSVNAPGNIVYRQKICKNCGRVYHTMEHVVGDSPSLRKDWKRYHRLYNKERRT